MQGDEDTDSAAVTANADEKDEDEEKGTFIPRVTLFVCASS